MNMEYWDGTFNFEYDSYENENYVECTDGKDTYVIDFFATCVASVTGREDSGSWDEPSYSEIDDVRLEDMNLSYCVAYKNVEDIGFEEKGYVFIDSSNNITLDNCDAKAKQLWNKLYVKYRDFKLSLMEILEGVVENYANDIAGDCDIDCF